MTHHELLAAHPYDIGYLDLHEEANRAFIATGQPGGRERSTFQGLR